jgi:hypothetical protein
MMRAFVGAVIANLVVIIGAFILGAISGHAATVVHSPAPTAPTEYGLAGGTSAVGTLVLFYVLTIGIPPLLIGWFGAFVAIMAEKPASKRPDKAK